jgi:hypothetical protein
VFCRPYHCPKRLLLPNGGSTLECILVLSLHIIVCTKHLSGLWCHATRGRAAPPYGVWSANIISCCSKTLSPATIKPMGQQEEMPMMGCVTLTCPFSLRFVQIDKFITKHYSPIISSLLFNQTKYPLTTFRYSLVTSSL